MEIFKNLFLPSQTSQHELVSQPSITLPTNHAALIIKKCILWSTKWEKSTFNLSEGQFRINC